MDWGSGIKDYTRVCGITKAGGRNLLIFDPGIENTGFSYLSIAGIGYPCCSLGILSYLLGFLSKFLVNYIWNRPNSF